MSKQFDTATTFSADELIQLVHLNRDTPYPAELSAEDLGEVLRAILETLMDGDTGKGMAALAALIDTVENLE